jgi:ATP-binding cassette subfamily C (CFTR/MRP) protein 4
MTITEANKNNYNNMLDSLIKSPVRYFDENPTGRILNRFTSDIGLMDLSMNFFLSESLEGTIYLINLLIFIIIKNVWLLIPTFFISFLIIKWT